MTDDITVTVDTATADGFEGVTPTWQRAILWQPRLSSDRTTARFKQVEDLAESLRELGNGN